MKVVLACYMLRKDLHDQPSNKSNELKVLIESYKEFTVK